MVARRLIRNLHTGTQVLAEVAQVGMAGGTRQAAPAGRNEREDDVVPWLQALDIRPDLLHHAGALVAADHR